MVQNKKTFKNRLVRQIGREAIGGGNGAGEVGVYDDAVKIADNQQGRAFQGIAVAQELVIGVRFRAEREVTWTFWFGLLLPQTVRQQSDEERLP